MTEQNPNPNEPADFTTEAEQAIERGETPDPYDISHKAMIMRSILQQREAEQDSND